MMPMIGITPSPAIDEAPHGTFHRYAISRTYVDAVRSAGGIPVVIPEGETDLPALFERIDGLLLSGGGDIDPARFGEGTVHEKTYGINEERDQFEIAAWRYAVQRDIPTLCICRGIQVMSVAQGGTLIQHIPDALSNPLPHRQHEVGLGRSDLSHDISLTRGDHPLRRIVEQDVLQVNSFHHQAVLTPGNDLEVIATSSDGVIEGMWHPRMGFGLGVQWHPEMLAAEYPIHAALFKVFVEATRRTVSLRSI